MSLTAIRRAMLAPAVILTAGACFATRNDVRVLQTDLQTMRQEAATAKAEAERRDADRVTQLARTDSALGEIARLLGTVTDSVRAMHATTMRLRGDVREDLVAIRQQLITVEARVGTSAQRIQELRADLEADAVERSAPTTTAVDTTKPPAAGSPGAAGTTPAGPGPAQLYQMAEDQRRRGSYGSARGAYGSLLTQFPRSDLAPDALFGIAQAFESEGKGASADSVYQLVVTQYPQSERAPTALYKRATAMRVAGRADDAKALYQQIVTKYPRSEAAVLAESFLGTARKP